MPAFMLTPQILRDLAVVHFQHQQGNKTASTILGGCRFSPSDVEAMVDCPAHVLTVCTRGTSLNHSLDVVSASMIIKIGDDWYQGVVTLHSIEEESRRRLVIIGSPEEWIQGDDMREAVVRLDRTARNELTFTLECLVNAYGWEYGRRQEAE